MRHSTSMSWQIAVRVVRRYFPQIMLPITMTIGFIGYTLESYVRPRRAVQHTPSASEQREERRLQELQQKSEKVEDVR